MPTSLRHSRSFVPAMPSTSATLRGTVRRRMLLSGTIFSAALGERQTQTKHCSQV